MAIKFRSYLVRPIFVVFLFLSAPLAGAVAPCHDFLISHELKAANLRHQANRYNIFRNATLYLDEFGPRFFEDIKRLPIDSHWLDSGAGQARAMWQFVEGLAYNGQSVRIQSRGLTALAITNPRSLDIHLLSKAQGREFRYLEGKYLEDYRLEEIGNCDLITDLFGPFSYTARIDLVLKKYMELLKPGGVLYIRMESVNITINQSAAGLGDYLQRIPNLRVEWLMNGTVIRVTKTGPVRPSDIPELHLDRYVDGAPPKRFYH